MVDFGSISGISGAFFAGMVTSLHCSLMCGPLACFLVPSKDSRWSFTTVTAAYQTCRILSYTIIGAIVGGIGMLALSSVEIYQQSIARFLPWALVLFFFVIATRLDSFLPKPKLFNRLTFKLQNKARTLPQLSSAAAMGSLTPLLPCGPLYTVFGLALMTQNPAAGAEFMLAFALGTLPLLWLVQSGFFLLKANRSPVMIQRIQRILAAVITLVLAYRLYQFETTSPNGLFCH